MTAPQGGRQWFDSFLAAYFVTAWGSGYLVTKIGLQYAAPFTYVTLRCLLAIAILAPVVLVVRPRWPATPREMMHVVVAGLLMHACNLSGSHYAQYLGLSAGITALILSAQPLATAVIAARWLGERLAPAQWTGVAIGLAGVALVVWHKIDVRAMTAGAAVAVAVSLVAVTAGTLYQRTFCPRVDLRAAPLVQFGASAAVIAPLAYAVEGAAVDWTWQLVASVVFMVVFASILATNVLHTLMRHGQATRVTSIMYLVPILAVLLEYAMFDVVPTPLSLAGIAITSVGVALVAWPRR
jgi:drug/metabolite transporter (DMT)-like permease